MFTLLLLTCIAAAAADPLRSSPLPHRCGRTHCRLSASQSIHLGSPPLPATPELVDLNPRSVNTFSALRSGTTYGAKMVPGFHYGKRDGGKSESVPANPHPIDRHGILRGETPTARRHHIPSTSDIFSRHFLSDKLETYLSRNDVENARAKPISDEATTMSPVYSQRNNYERPVSKDFLLNKLYIEATPSRRHWQQRLDYRTNPKHNKETPAHLGNLFTDTSFESYNWQSGGALHQRSREDYNSMVFTGKVAQILKDQGVTLTFDSDDIVSVKHSAATTEEQAHNEPPHTTARKSVVSLQNANVPSLRQSTASPLQSHPSIAEGHLSRDYRPSTAPGTRDRVGQNATAATKSEDGTTDPASLPSTSVNEVTDSDVGVGGVIEVPDPDFQKQQDQIEEAIVRDATLIIVFSCLAVASFAMWRIIRCITMHKLKQLGTELAVEKATTV